ncbi:MAG: NADH-quinone oxidoreductase subunit C [Terracidiphilus sp.]
MNPVETVAEQLKIKEPTTDASGVSWFPTENLAVRETAAVLRSAGARFITITATELPPGQGFRLEYIWDLEGMLLGFAFLIPGRETFSIYDITEAADWIEREVHEEFAIDFAGRACEPLLLREGSRPGVYLHEVAK